MDAPRPEVVQSGSGLSGEYRISAQVQRVDAHDAPGNPGRATARRDRSRARFGATCTSADRWTSRYSPGTWRRSRRSPRISRARSRGRKPRSRRTRFERGAADGAVGAYDCFAVKDARAVFTVDTWTQKLTLHEAEASPLAGGEGRASGTVRLDLNALSHPNAVNVEMEAEGFDPRSVVNSFAMKGATASAARADEAKLASTSESETERWVAALPGGAEASIRFGRSPERDGRATRERASRRRRRGEIGEREHVRDPPRVVRQDRALVPRGGEGDHRGSARGSEGGRNVGGGGRGHRGGSEHHATARVRDGERARGRVQDGRGDELPSVGSRARGEDDRRIARGGKAVVHRRGD